MRVPDTYLGDGVYASFDGFQIWLKARRASLLGEELWHDIALTPEACLALAAYAKKISEALRAEEPRK